MEGDLYTNLRVCARGNSLRDFSKGKGAGRSYFPPPVPSLDTDICGNEHKLFATSLLTVLPSSCTSMDLPPPTSHPQQEFYHVAAGPCLKWICAELTDSTCVAPTLQYTLGRNPSQVMHEPGSMQAASIGASTTPK